MSDKWETSVGSLRLVGGLRQERPKNLGVAERRSRLGGRSRDKGQLYVLVELGGEAFGREETCEDLVSAIVNEYFRTSGTVTYGLRHAVLLANTQLVRANARVTTEHRTGGVVCVVLRDGELFVAQAGWTSAHLVHGQHVSSFPGAPLDYEDPALLGHRQTIDVRLFQATVQAGDVVLMVDSPMARQLDSEHIGRSISGGVSRAVAALEALAPHEDCTAMVIQLGSPLALPRHRREQRAFAPVEAPPVTDAGPAEPPVSLAPPTHTTAPERAQPVVPPSYAETAPSPPPPVARERTRPAGPTLGERAQGVLAAVVGGARTLGQQMLPDRPARSSPRRRRAARARRGDGRSVGQPHLGIAAALAIPVVALVIVGGYALYRNWSTRSQFDARLEAARLKRDIALSNAESPGLAREDWLEVMALAKEADAAQQGNAEVAQLLSQAAFEVDRIDGVMRLGQPIKLYEYITPGSVPTRVIVAVLDVYVLDRGTGRVYHHALNEQRTAVRNADADQVLIQEAQSVEGQTAGMLVDITWMQEGGERQAGALQIVDRNGLLIEYDPSWDQFRTQVLGGRDVWRGPVALRTFDSNLYLLDTAANQIWKYTAEQFTSAPAGWVKGEVDLQNAVDLGIDGSIYVLRSTGRLEQFFAGETTPFAISQIPQPLASAKALHVDTEDIARYIYVADEAEARIVQLDRDGVFVRQLRPPAGMESSFQGLSGLFPDERDGKLYYTAGNALYVAGLPAVQR